jgi:hypothetical protein
VDAVALCHTNLYFLHSFLGVALPTLTACYFRCPSTEAPAELGAAAAAEADSQPGCRSVGARLVRCGRAVLAAGDCVLLEGLGGHTGWGWRLLISYYLLALCWWLSVLPTGIF